MSTNEGLHTGSHELITIKPLRELMDNVLAARLGEVVREAYAAPAGDDIDRGLILRRLLKERGFIIGIVGHNSRLTSLEDQNE